MIGNEHRLVREPSGWQRENVHEWTAFLRSEDGSPLDEIIDHMIFEVRQFHESFARVFNILLPNFSVASDIHTVTGSHQPAAVLHSPTWVGHV